MKTKEYIITNATELFNRQGVTATSLRQLANYLEMSDGNLRYHYKNKEELILIIFKQMIQDMNALSEQGNKLTEINLLEETRKQFQLSFYLMYQYRFLFIESTQLLKQYVRFRQVFQELILARKSSFLKFFGDCKARGILSNNFDDAYYETLFEQIFIISDNWLKYLDVDGHGTLDQKINHYIHLCLALLHPIIRQPR